jgi:hypothetical protein
MTLICCVILFCRFLVLRSNTNITAAINSSVKMITTISGHFLSIITLYSLQHEIILTWKGEEILRRTKSCQPPYNMTTGAGQQPDSQQ